MGVQSTRRDEIEGLALPCVSWQQHPSTCPGAHTVLGSLGAELWAIGPCPFATGFVSLCAGCIHMLLARPGTFYPLSQSARSKREEKGTSLEALR